MKPDIIKDEIIDVLESLKEQIPVLISYEEKIPRIELDIVLNNIRKLYENIDDLKRCDKGNDNELIEKNKTEIVTTDIDEKVEKPVIELKIEEEVVEEKTQKEDKKEDAAVDEQAITEIETPKREEVQPEEEMPEEIIEDNVQEEVQEEEEIKEIKVPGREPVKIVFETKEEEIIAPKKRQIKDKSEIDLFSTSEPTIADKYKDQTSSLNEKIVDDKEDKSIAAKMQKEQITDIKLAIGLNEKFLFINELFDGDMQVYNDSIEKINSQPSLKDAVIFLNQLKSRFEWEETDETYIKLQNLVERKF
jgi:hypothetical protein